MASKNKCTKYVSASLVVHFPEEEGIQCKLCPCLETYARKQCRLTGEYLADGYLIGGLFSQLTFILSSAKDIREYASAV